MKTRPLLAAAVLLWFTIGLAYYYAFHRPFTPEFAVRAVLGVRDLLCVGMLFAAAGGLGARLLPSLPVAPLARLAVRGALGLGLLSLLYLLLGSTLGTGAVLAWLALLALLVTLWRHVRTWWQDAADLSALWQASGRLGSTLAWLSAGIVAIALPLALAPPLVFDALVYHLSLPKIYLLQGQVGYVAEIMHWGQPQLVHMLATWAGALGVGHGALVAWGLGVLALLGLLGHVTERWGARLGWVAVASLLSGASLAASLSSAYMDWGGVLFGWGMLVFLDVWYQHRENRWIVWAGLLCGLAFGTKYTAGILAPLGVLALLVGRAGWRDVARYLAAALAMALPWLGRNWASTGNPFYPLLLPGGEMDALRIAYVQSAAPQGNWLDVLLLPLRATWLGVEYGRVGSAAAYDVSVGPLLLMFGLLAVVPWTAAHTQLRRTAAVVALGGMLVWGLLGRVNGHAIHTHLYFSLFPAFAILAAYGFGALDGFRLGTVRLPRIAAALAVLALALSLLQSSLTLVERGALELWAGTLDEQTYAEHNLGLYALVMKELPPAPTLMLWEARGFACAPNCDPDEVIDRWQHDLARFGSPEAVIESWRAAEYDYVLYYRLGAEFVYNDPDHFHAFDLPQVEAALTQLPVVRDFNEDYVLYALNP